MYLISEKLARGRKKFYKAYHIANVGKMVLSKFRLRRIRKFYPITYPIIYSVFYPITQSFTQLFTQFITQPQSCFICGRNFRPQNFSFLLRLYWTFYWTMFWTFLLNFRLGQHCSPQFIIDIVSYIGKFWITFLQLPRFPRQLNYFQNGNNSGISFC